MFGMFKKGAAAEDQDHPAVEIAAYERAISELERLENIAIEEYDLHSEGTLSEIYYDGMAEAYAIALRALKDMRSEVEGGDQ